jgi:hypothetical protein
MVKNKKCDAAAADEIWMATVALATAVLWILVG